MDAGDAEVGERILVSDAADRSSGSHQLRFVQVVLDSPLLNLDIPFLFAVADPNGTLAELNETNNLQGFIGVFHRPASPAPLIFRGSDLKADSVSVASDGTDLSIDLGDLVVTAALADAPA